MYYYIMEPAQKHELAWQEKVKNILGDLGIAGETVTPSPARTIEELAYLGVIKGYSTIVAVGSEKIINKITTTIINQKENKDVVLGMIPNNYEGMLAKKIQVKDLKEACLALKHRKLETIDLCFVEPNKYFLTLGILESNKTTDAYLSTSFFKAGLPFNKITIEPGLKITIADSSSEQISGKKFLGWLFGKKEKDIYSSLFYYKKIKIETPDTNISLRVDDEIIAKTPIICQSRSRALKIIVARDNISMKT